MKAEIHEDEVLMTKRIRHISLGSFLRRLACHFVCKPMYGEWGDKEMGKWGNMEIRALFPYYLNTLSPTSNIIFLRLLGSEPYQCTDTLHPLYHFR